MASTTFNEVADQTARMADDGCPNFGPASVKKEENTPAKHECPDAARMVGEGCPLSYYA
jgi:hypothetical protein